MKRCVHKNFTYNDERIIYGKGYVGTMVFARCSKCNKHLLITEIKVEVLE